MFYQKIQIIIDYINKKESFDKTNDLDINYLIKLCKNHSLLPLLYVSLKKYNIELNEEQEKYLTKAYKNAVFIEAVQETEKSLILDALFNNNIKCMPLKGSIIKYLYPSPELRTMSDLDILYEPGKGKLVNDVLSGLGYKCEKSGGTDDEYNKPPFMNVEMHRIMVDGNFEAIADYYNNIWDVVKPIKEGSLIYEMSKEDFYIHMVAHVARHYAVGGIGIRFVFDEWIYLTHYGDVLNFDYINSEFEKIDLLKFAENFKNMTIKWFKGLETTELEEQMTKYIFESGTHGSIAHEQSVKVLLGKDGMKNFKSNKFLYVIRMIFPSFKYMKARNHILKKWPILLPYFYIERICVAIFKKKKLVVQSIKGLDTYNQDKAKEIHELHENSGI